MSHVFFPNDRYVTPEGKETFFSALLPSVFFTLRVMKIIWHDGKLAAAGEYSGADWSEGSYQTVQVLEQCGVHFSVTGMDNIDRVDGPCVFICNHMSTLETFVLPCLIQPRKAVTFVVKDSLVKYPWFGPVLQARDPITVHRQNPREDLTAVLEGGVDRLNKGISIIVFPQSTRSYTLDTTLFNSIGVKLAKRAGRPVIPVALRTDAWKMGRFVKDFGGINTKIPVNFAFGEPMEITGNGKEQHAAVCEFIAGKLGEWNEPFPAGQG